MDFKSGDLPPLPVGWCARDGQHPEHANELARGTQWRQIDYRRPGIDDVRNDRGSDDDDESHELAYAESEEPVYRVEVLVND